MRPLLLVVASLVVAVGASSRQLQDLNVIATEPGRAEATKLHTSTANRGLLCQSGELIDEYCALSSSSSSNSSSSSGQRRPVCASDGRVYASACELARASCLPGAPNLCRLPDESWCQAQQSRTERCSREAYQLFKMALWREFNSSASLLFDQLDQNRDGRLGAHELWPKLSAREYDHDDKLEENHDHLEANSCDPMTTDNQLGELAFERHFHWSPCSLSHLLVHENTSTGAGASTRRQMTRAEFVRLFDEFVRPPPHDEDGGHRSQPAIAAITSEEVIMQMGDTKLIYCMAAPSSGAAQNWAGQHCAWTRHGVNLASIRNSEPHVSIVADNNQPPRLRLMDAQLYLSGVYRCSCYGPAQDKDSNSNKKSYHTVHLIRVQVLAQPQVSVRPKFQWSLPGSRVAFECRHDHIDTSSDNQRQLLEASHIQWFQNKRPISSATNSSQPEKRGERHRLVLERVKVEDSGQYTCQVNASADHVRGDGSARLLIQDQPVAAAAGTVAASLQDQTTGQDLLADHSDSLLWSFHAGGVSVFRLQLPEDGQELELVRELSGQSHMSDQLVDGGNLNQQTLCGGGGGKTGGLTPSDQLVICEWSDNAVLVEVASPQTTVVAGGQRPERKYIYIGQPNLNRVLVFDGHAGELVAMVPTEPQPRRLFAFKPNKIHLSKWVRRRLGPMGSLRWLQALEYHQQQLASGKHYLQSQAAHPLRMTPKSSRLYSHGVAPTVGQRNARWPLPGSSGPEYNDDDDDDDDDVDNDDSGGGGAGGAQDRVEDNNVGRRFRRHSAGWTRKWAGEQTNTNTNTNDREPVVVAAAAAAAPANSQQQHQQQQRSLQPPVLPRLVQYDIWLLCYGKLLPVDAHQSDLSDLLSPAPTPLEGADDEVEEDERNHIDDQEAGHQRHRINRLRAQKTRQRVKDDRAHERAQHNQSEPTFMPWPHWASLSPLLAHQTSMSKEARMRNRKSVQIIQSTFLPVVGRALSPHHHHHYNQQPPQMNASGSQALNEFKRLTVLTTHHVIAGPRTVGPLTAPYNELGAQGGPFITPNSPARASIDLVQDLCVPERAHSQAANPKFKLHHAYVTHYAERQLYRIAMDTYRYDREIDLHQCDPLSLIPAVQGLLIVQCRAPITHQLNGQLVLDELTSARVQFNAQIKAQQAHLTPDSRYLVSILANESTTKLSRRDSDGHIDNQHGKQNQQSSVIYVQSVRVAGLKFMYEIKATSLEVAWCSFVWRDGYYAAIFVALNRRDRQTELLSLRLADGRLELIVRVPSLAWSPTARHRDPLNVNQELQVASLSTSDGLYLVDLEENRVIQGVHDHNHRSRQASLPTLLWV